jgi:uracil-DNA glycosylase
VDTKKLPVIEAGWFRILASCFDQEYMQRLSEFLITEKKSGYTIYPPSDKVFNALNTTPFDKVSVVILGQDPYHGIGQAHGLCFSVSDGVKPPPSLVNIYKELAADLGSNFQIPKSGNLTKWAEQGVLLLNTALTVRANQALSHRNQGWEIFTDHIIKTLSDQKQNLIFVLWGSPAKSKMSLIDQKKHIILTAAHPSPLSAYRGFLGCRHFSQINQHLKKLGKPEIMWQI